MSKTISSLECLMDIVYLHYLLIPESYHSLTKSVKPGFIVLIHLTSFQLTDFSFCFQATKIKRYIHNRPHCIYRYYVGRHSLHRVGTTPRLIAHESRIGWSSSLQPMQRFLHNPPFKSE